MQGGEPSQGKLGAPKGQGSGGKWGQSPRSQEGSTQITVAFYGGVSALMALLGRVSIMSYRKNKITRQLTFCGTIRASQRHRLSGHSAREPFSPGSRGSLAMQSQGLAGSRREDLWIGAQGFWLLSGNRPVHSVSSPVPLGEEPSHRAGGVQSPDGWSCSPGHRFCTFRRRWKGAQGTWSQADLASPTLSLSLPWCVCGESLSMTLIFLPHCNGQALMLVLAVPPGAQ